MVGCHSNSGRLGQLGDFGHHQLDQEWKGVLQSRAQVDVEARAEDKVGLPGPPSHPWVAMESEGSRQKGDLSGKVEVNFHAIVVCSTRHIDSTAHQRLVELVEP